MFVLGRDFEGLCTGLWKPFLTGKKTNGAYTKELDSYNHAVLTPCLLPERRVRADQRFHRGHLLNRISPQFTEGDV